MLLTVSCGPFIDGCNGSPAVLADRQAVATIQAEIKTASTQPAATQPTVLDPTPLLAELQSQLKAAAAKLASDQAAANAANAEALASGLQTIVASIPSPWTPLAQTVIAVIGMAVVGWIGKGATTNAVTAQAASHSATTLAMADQLANSIPISKLPATVQPIAAAAVSALDALSK